MILLLPEVDEYIVIYDEITLPCHFECVAINILAILYERNHGNITSAVVTGHVPMDMSISLIHLSKKVYQILSKICY